MVDGEPWKLGFFSLTSTIFNFSLQGTFRLLGGRDILRQCSQELRACRAAKPGFFVAFQLKLVSIPLTYRHVEFGMEKSGCVCTSVSVHSHKEGNKSVSPICGQADFLLGWDIKNTGDGQGAKWGIKQ